MVKLPINPLNIPYPDFQTGGIIDSEQFDENNAALQGKINEISQTMNDGLGAEFIGDGEITDAKIGERLIDSSPSGEAPSSGTLGVILNWFAKQLKAIVGGDGWSSTPPDTLTGLDTGQQRTPMLSQTLQGRGAPRKRSRVMPTT